MIIDAHTHLFFPAVKERRDFYFPDPHFSLLYRDEKARIADCDNLLAAMDKSSVDFSVAMGFPWREETPAREQNEYFARVAHDHPRRILPFGSIALRERNIRERVREVKALGLGGIGEIGFYSDGLERGGEVYLRRVMEAAAEESLPLCLHVNEPVGHAYTGKYEPQLERLYRVILDFPGVKLILAHWGGGFPFYELMPEVREAFKNVVYDTAASPFLYDPKIYSIVADCVGEDRILFGSDFPLIPFDRYRKEIDKALADESFKRKILGENAARFFKY